MCNLIFTVVDCMMTRWRGAVYVRPLTHKLSEEKHYSWNRCATAAIDMTSTRLQQQLSNWLQQGFNSSYRHNFNKTPTAANELTSTRLQQQLSTSLQQDFSRWILNQQWALFCHAPRKFDESTGKIDDTRKLLTSLQIFVPKGRYWVVHNFRQIW